MTIVLNHRRIQRLYANGDLKDVPEGSPLDVALGVAAWGPLQNPFLQLWSHDCDGGDHWNADEASGLVAFRCELPQSQLLNKFASASPV
jgi:hypothetical protein